MPKEFSRTRRVGGQIQRELAELIRSEIKDPGLGMISIVGVEVSKDMGNAKVFISALDPQQGVDSLRALERASGFLRRLLGQRMHMRAIPQLRFILDDTIARGMEMDSLIDQAVSADLAKREDEEPTSNE